MVDIGEEKNVKDVGICLFLKLFLNFGIKLNIWEWAPLHTLFCIYKTRISILLN